MLASHAADSVRSATAGAETSGGKLGTFLAKAVNVTMISLDDAPGGYKDFDQGAAKKFVIDPNGMVH